MSRDLVWKRTTEDGRRIFRAEPYEIVELYDPLPGGEKFQLNKQDQYRTTTKTIREAKRAAEMNRLFDI